MHKLKTILALLFFWLNGFLMIAQPAADSLYNPVISDPAYEPGKGPVILIDEAHNNYHTLKGGFSPFARVLERDGYTVIASAEIIARENFGQAKILVIANALHQSNRGNWRLPTPSAFSDEEIQIIKDWINDGGSLFLIADHMPFAGAAEKLAASFGVKFYNGFASKGSPPDVFSPEKGLETSIVTRGRNQEENVTSLQTFMGQAFDIPKAATPVIVLDSRYEIKMPQAAWQFNSDTQIISGEGRVQGAYMPWGKGRIVIFGEAAMFTAQVQGKNRIGLNKKSASQNLQFLLNTIHWLDGIL